MYVPHESSSETCIRREDHNECPTAYTKILAVISLSGNYSTPNTQLFFHVLIKKSKVLKKLLGRGVYDGSYIKQIFLSI